MIVLQQRGYFGRMQVYLAEMFPLPRHLLMAALVYIAVAAFVARSHGEAFSPVSVRSAIGIWSVFALLLMLRLMDEIKDRDIDARLFPGRALPSGRVLASDILFSLALVAALYVFANLAGGEALWVALFALGYAMLMFLHFFARDALRGNLLLTLATHNLIVPIIVIYALVLSAGEFGLSPMQLDWHLAGPFIAMIWAAILSWEISRKIRSREEESAYVTYSRLLRPSGAVLLAGGAQTLAVAFAVLFYLTQSLSPAYLAIIAAGYAAALFGHLRFLRHPCARTSKLKPYAEVFIVAVFCAQIVGFGGLL